MRKAIFTKNDVINALINEPLPLKKDYFFALSDELEASNSALTLSGDPDLCSVCAVGAVIRSKFSDVDGDSASDYFCKGSFAWDDVFYVALENENYLGALSIYFESLPDNLAQDEIKISLINFVESSFPQKIELEIP